MLYLSSRIIDVQICPIIRLIQLMSAVKQPLEPLLRTGWKADPAPATIQTELWQVSVLHNTKQGKKAIFLIYEMWSNRNP